MPDVFAIFHLTPSESISLLISLKPELHGTFFTVNKLCLANPKGMGGEADPALLISQAEERLAFRYSSSSDDLLLEKGHASEDSCHELQVQPGESPPPSEKGERRWETAAAKNMPLSHVENKVNRDVLCGYNSGLRF